VASAKINSTISAFSPRKANGL